MGSGASQFSVDMGKKWGDTRLWDNFFVFLWIVLVGILMKTWSQKDPQKAVYMHEEIIYFELPWYLTGRKS